ncbi:MAG: serine/threonine-protein kinase [Candidatus Acidiferrales bacterium]
MNIFPNLNEDSSKNHPRCLEDFLGQTIDSRFSVMEGVKGGMGYILFCRDAMSGQAVVLKLQRHGQGSADLFLGEAQTWISLGVHPHIVEAKYAAQCNYGTYIVLEMIPSTASHGCSLRHWLKELFPFAPVVILGWMFQVCEAMQYASEKASVVHRDIKPENILICPNLDAKLTDFGLASSRMAAGIEGGTPLYMAPEQYGGQADVRSDIYSAGLVLAELCLGHLPARKISDQHSLLARHTEDSTLDEIPSSYEMGHRSYRFCHQILTAHEIQMARDEFHAAQSRRTSSREVESMRDSVPQRLLVRALETNYRPATRGALDDRPTRLSGSPLATRSPDGVRELDRFWGHISRVLGKCLSPLAEQRYQTFSDLKIDLDACYRDCFGVSGKELAKKVDRRSVHLTNQGLALLNLHDISLRRVIRSTAQPKSSSPGQQLVALTLLRSEGIQFLQKGVALSPYDLAALEKLRDILFRTPAGNYRELSRYILNQVRENIRVTHVWLKCALYMSVLVALFLASPASANAKIAAGAIGFLLAVEGFVNHYSKLTIRPFQYGMIGLCSILYALSWLTVPEDRISWGRQFAEWCGGCLGLYVTLRILNWFHRREKGTDGFGGGTATIISSFGIILGLKSWLLFAAFFLVAPLIVGFQYCAHSIGMRYLRMHKHFVARPFEMSRSYQIPASYPLLVTVLLTFL